MQTLGERLLNAEASRGAAESPHAESLGDVGPRLQSADILRKVSADLSQLPRLLGGAPSEMSARPSEAVAPLHVPQ